MILYGVKTEVCALCLFVKLPAKAIIEQVIKRNPSFFFADFFFVF